MLDFADRCTVYMIVHAETEPFTYLSPKLEAATGFVSRILHIVSRCNPYAWIQGRDMAGLRHRIARCLIECVNAGRQGCPVSRHQQSCGVCRSSLHI